MKWKWEIHLDEMVGKFVHLETRDGSIREGKLTGIETYDLEINNSTYRVPMCFQINGDALDTISFQQIKEMTLR